MTKTQDTRRTHGRFEFHLEVHGTHELYGDAASAGARPGFTRAVFFPDALPVRLLLLDQRRATAEATAADAPGLFLAPEVVSVLESEEQAAEVLRRLAEAAFRRGVQFQATLVQSVEPDLSGSDHEELSRILPRKFHAALAQEKEREGRLSYLQVCTGGLPPLVHATASGIVFPVRSWVPAGLFANWNPLCQNAECEPGDRLVLHTELRAGPEALKSFHTALRSGQLNWDALARENDAVFAVLGIHERSIS